MLEQRRVPLQLRVLWQRWGGKVFRYATGSVVAAACSEVVFVLMFGVLGSTTMWATLVGWLAGALPNYWLNRTWTWRVSGRPRFLEEVLPYVVIIVVTLVTAVVATDAVNRWLDGRGFGHGVDVVLVAATFLGVYGVMFLLRFFLLEQLFGRMRHHVADPTNEVIPQPVKDSV